MIFTCRKRQGLNRVYENRDKKMTGLYKALCLAICCTPILLFASGKPEQNKDENSLNYQNTAIPHKADTVISPASLVPRTTVINRKYLVWYLTGNKETYFDASSSPNPIITLISSERISSDFTIRLVSGLLEFPLLREGQTMYFDPYFMSGGDRFTAEIQCRPQDFSPYNNSYAYTISLDDYPELGKSLYAVEFISDNNGKAVNRDGTALHTKSLSLHIPNFMIAPTEQCDPMIFSERNLDYSKPDFTDFRGEKTVSGWYFTCDERYAYVFAGEDSSIELEVFTKDKPALPVKFSIESSALVTRTNKNPDDFFYVYDAYLLHDSFMLDYADDKTIFGKYYRKQDYSLEPQSFTKKNGRWSASTAVHPEPNHKGIYTFIPENTEIASYKITANGEIQKMPAEIPDTGAQNVKRERENWNYSRTSKKEPVSNTNPGLILSINRPDNFLEQNTPELFGIAVDYYTSHGINTAVIQQTITWNDGTPLSFDRTYAEYLWVNYGKPLYLRLECWNPDFPDDNGFFTALAQNAQPLMDQFKDFVRSFSEKNIPVFLAVNPQMNHHGKGSEKYPWQGNIPVYTTALKNLHAAAQEAGGETVLFVLDADSHIMGNYDVKSYYIPGVFDMITLGDDMTVRDAYGSPAMVSEQIDDQFDQTLLYMEEWAPDVPVCLRLRLPNLDKAHQEFILGPMQKNFPKITFYLIEDEEGDFALSEETYDTMEAHGFSSNVIPFITERTNIRFTQKPSYTDTYNPRIQEYLLPHDADAFEKLSAIARIAVFCLQDQDIHKLIQTLAIPCNIGIYNKTYLEIYKIIYDYLEETNGRKEYMSEVLYTLDSRGFFGFDHISAMMQEELFELKQNMKSGKEKSLLSDFKENTNVKTLLTVKTYDELLQILYRVYAENYGEHYASSSVFPQSGSKMNFDSFSTAFQEKGYTIMQNIRLLQAVYF